MKKTPFLFIILAGIFWGTSGLFVHFLSPRGFSPLHMAAVRGTIAFLGLGLFALIRNRSLFRVRLTELFLFLCIGATMFGSATFYYSSMQMTSVSTAVVLMYTAPVYVSIVSALCFGERFGRLKLLAVGLMLVGCCLVSGIIGGLRFDPLGILLGALSGISYAGYNVLTKWALRRGSAALSTSLYSFLFMAIISVCACRVWQIPSLVAKNPPLLIPLLLGLGIFTYVLPFLLYTLAMRDLPAGTASALGIVEPMAATLFSVVFLGEALTVFSILGILLILFSVFLLSKTESSTHTDLS